VRPPTTLPIGRYAVLDDPQGGTFSILQSANS
jgi:predicted enzyme related to lactoylglutathione lyase